MTSNSAIVFPAAARRAQAERGSARLYDKKIAGGFPDGVTAELAGFMVKHFTTRELSAMADFYGSPEGKSALEKFGPYMGDIMPMLQAEMQHAVEAAQAEKAGNANKPGT